MRTPQEQWSTKLCENILYELSQHLEAFFSLPMESEKMEEFIQIIAAIVGARPLSTKKYGADIFSLEERKRMVRKQIAYVKEEHE